MKAFAELSLLMFKTLQDPLLFLLRQIEMVHFKLMQWRAIGGGAYPSVLTPNHGSQGASVFAPIQMNQSVMQDLISLIHGDSFQFPDLP